MDFIALDSIDTLEQIKDSKDFVVILKHNTTCPISKGVLQRLRSEATEMKEAKTVYVLDLLEHRNISDKIEEIFKVKHESPQLLVIRNGECIYTEWGFDISAGAADEAMKDVGVNATKV